MKKFVLGISAVLLGACSVCRQAQRHSVAEIQFGNGGGVTGAVKTYCLKPDGSITLNGEPAGHVPCDSVLACFDAAETFSGKHVQPGNTYSFVRVVRKNGESNYYSWTFGDFFDKKIINLHHKLMKWL